MKKIISFLFTLMVLFGSSGIDAQNKKDATRKKMQPKKVIQLEEMIVEGKIQKPEAFYILGRSEIDFKKVEVKKSFINKIKTLIKRKPF